MMPQFGAHRACPCEILTGSAGSPAHRAPAYCGMDLGGASPAVIMRDGFGRYDMATNMAPKSFVEL